MLQMTAPTTTDVTITDASEADRYVFCDRPRCPLCGGVRLRIIRSWKDSEVESRQWKECRNEECGHRFFVVWQ